MTQFPKGVSFEGLTGPGKEFRDFVDQHLPAYRSGAARRGRTYGIEESEDPTALSYVQFDSSLGEGEEGLATETHSIEFTIMGPASTFISVFTIVWASGKGFDIACANGEESVDDPDFVMQQLDKLRDLEADGKMLSIAQTAEDKS